MGELFRHVLRTARGDAFIDYSQAQSKYWEAKRNEEDAETLKLMRQALCMTRARWKRVYEYQDKRAAR